MNTALEQMEKPELVKYARELGIPADGRAAKNALIAAIAEKVTAPAHPSASADSLQHPCRLPQDSP